MSANIDLGKTQITPTIRVSSAAIFYDLGHLQYFQYETFIFSKDPSQRTIQQIHGTCQWRSDRLERKTNKIHNYIANNLKLRHT